MKIMKRIVLIVLILIVLLFSTIIFLPEFINWNRYAPYITEAVKESTGRELSIKGEINLSLFPVLKFDASHITFSNEPGIEPAHMVSIESISGEIKLFPLLQGKVIVDSFLIKRPAINLTINNDDRPNWLFKQSGKDSQKETPHTTKGDGSLPVKDLSIVKAKITDGHLSFTDDRTGQNIVARNLNIIAGLKDLNNPFGVRMELFLNEKPVEFDLRIDSLATLLNSGRLEVQTQLASQHINSELIVNLREGAIPLMDSSIDFRIESITDFAAWLDMPFPSSYTDPGHLAIRGNITSAGDNKISINQFNISGDELGATLNGSYEVQDGKHIVNLDGYSRLLNIDDYIPPFLSTQLRKDSANQPKGKEKSDFSALFSKEPFDLSMLNKLDVTVEFLTKRIEAFGYKIEKSKMKAIIGEGGVSFNLEELQLGGGNIKALLNINSSGEKLELTTNLNIKHLKVDDIFPKDMQSPPITGVLNANYNFRSAGTSPAELFASLKGEAVSDLKGVNIKDAPSGSLSAMTINLSIPGPDSEKESPLILNGNLVFNKKRVNLDINVDSLNKALSGDPFALKAMIDSKPVTLSYNGQLWQNPLPGLDGAFQLKIPSVGRLASWMNNPLKAGQPDPGPLEIKAEFKGEGATVAIKEATVKGKSLNAKVTGSFDASDNRESVKLNVESGFIDLDSYLPKSSGKEEPPRNKRAQEKHSADILSALSQEPFDLKSLRNKDGDINISIKGIKIMDTEIGPILFSSTFKNGVLKADLKKLGLYGGTLTGTTNVDGSGDSLTISSDLKVNSINVGKLIKSGSKQKMSAKGTASAGITFSGKGKTEKSLVESLKGNLSLNLKDVEIKDKTTHTISSLQVAFTLPGIKAKPGLKGDIVYNKRPLSLEFSIDPLKTVLSGEPFNMETGISSELIKLTFAGKVQQKPLPGIDGDLDLNITSVGELARWTGNPLNKNQPDPGPIKLRATFESEQERVALKEAYIEGKALKVRASAGYDGKKVPPLLTAKIDVKEADMNAYLPKAEPKKTKEPVKKKEPAQWSSEPIDFSALAKYDGDIQINISSLKYGEIEINPGQVDLKLQNSILKTSVKNFHFAGGSLEAAAMVNASNPVATIGYKAGVNGIEAGPVLKTVSGKAAITGKTILQTEGSTKGRSQKDFIESLNGKGNFKFTDGAVNGFNIASSLRKAGTLGLGSGAAQKTDFAELSGSFQIVNGVVDNRDLKMQAPLLRLHGEGIVPLPAMSIDYMSEVTLVATLKGQGANDSLAGLPIPVTIKGPWSDLSIGVDWKSVLTQSAADPSRLKNMPSNLKQLGQSLGVNLSGAKGSKKDGLNNLIKSVPGILLGEDSQKTNQNQGTGQKKQPSPADAIKSLKGLFGK